MISGEGNPEQQGKLRERADVLLEAPEENPPRMMSPEEVLRFTRFSLDHCCEAVFWTTEDARFFDVNQAACRSLGYSREEILDMTVFDVDPEISPGDWKEHWKEVEQQGARVIESQHRAKDGSLFPVELSINHFDYEGAGYHCIFARDVTDRKRTDEALRNSEERLRMLFECAPDGYYLSDLKGNFLDGNRAAEELVGYKREELVGKSFLSTGVKLLSPSQLPKAAALLAKSALGYRTGPDDFLLNTSRGSQVPVEISTFPVTIQGQRQILGIARDISKRSRAEAALRASEQKYQALVENLRDVVYSFDPDGTVYYVSPNVESWFGYTVEEIVGRNFMEFVHPDDRQLVLAAYEKTMSTREQFPTICRLLRKDGGCVHVEELGKVLTEGGEIVGVTGVLRDITERKRAEKAIRRAERLSSLGTLAAGIAHEINNPVGSALLAAEIALAIKDDPDEAERFEKCVNNVIVSLERCGRIVRNVLTFSRDEPAQKQPCQISEVIQQSWDLARSYAQRHHATIQLALDRDLPEVVIGRLDMELALINLLRNAITACGEDGQIMIRTELVDAGIRISVEDNGCGITDEQKTHLFDPFYSTWQAKGGTGLGLSITYGIVQDHGGVLEVRSAPGKGTTVSVTLPVEEGLRQTGNEQRRSSDGCT